MEQLGAALVTATVGILTATIGWPQAALLAAALSTSTVGILRATIGWPQAALLTAALVTATVGILRAAIRWSQAALPGAALVTATACVLRAADLLAVSGAARRRPGHRDSRRSSEPRLAGRKRRCMAPPWSPRLPASSEPQTC